MDKWMEKAYHEAIKGMESGDGGPFGAAVVKDGKLLSLQHNRVLSTNDPTAHAEVNAIREASQKLGRFDLSDCVLYTTCYPCPMCLGALLWARIPVVYFGATDADAASGGFDDERFHTFWNNPESAIALKPLDLEQTRTLFDRWNAKEDRKMY